MVDLTLLKKLINRKFNNYTLSIMRGYSHDKTKYKKIKQAMMDVIIIENYNINDFLASSLIDFHTINLNKL